MTPEQINSWIFLSIALASQSEPSSISGISEIADGINHSIPTQKELQKSFYWLLEKELILKTGRRYGLTQKGKVEYVKASEKSKIIFNIWKSLELKLKNYA